MMLTILILGTMNVIGYIYSRKRGMPAKGKSLIPYYWLHWGIKNGK